MNFGANAGKTMSVFSNHAWFILKLSAASFAISILSLGLMAPVLFSGLGIIVLKTGRGEKAVFADLFTHMDKTLQLFALSLIITLAACAGIIFVFLPVLILAVWMYAVFYMAYENKGIGESLSMSANAAVKNGFFRHLIASLALCILNAAGASFFLVGLIITVPLTAGFLAFCFESLER
jgi:hypothetical protein